MKALSKNFVIFFSPGTLFAEQTMKEIGSWNVDRAVEMSKSIKERYNAIPFGFCFITRERTENDLDSKETKRSNMYYLGGEVLTLKQIKERNDPKDKILISNMEGNRWKKVVKNTNSWSWMQPLKEDDVILKL